ncbi:MAG: MBL fold metallo-hydrolase [Rhodobacteraceae bacterium]|nr:MBL fold metallo-hydrolase [Paracoccaceae bacterium]
MTLTRRSTILTGAAALAGAGLSAFPRRARAAGGAIGIRPISHASFVMTLPEMVIWNDPVGGAELYAGQPAPDLILITHEHGDHLDVPTLEAVVSETTVLVTNPAVHGMLPAALQARATPLANGERTEVGALSIEAIPAYNTTPERLQYHPQGRDNGYLLTAGDTRIYIAGDTEDTPEMRALEDIDIAFLPMNLPYTMTVEQAAAAVAAFRPAEVWPYHYRDSDVEAFAAAVAEGDSGTEVRRGPWY